MNNSNHKASSADDASYDEDDPQVWLSLSSSAANNSPNREHRLLCQQLHDLEQSWLRCPICRELLHVAVSVAGCQHTFCSECLRRHCTAASGKGTPVVWPGGFGHALGHTRTEYERQLQPNRTVQGLVQAFQQLRSGLLQQLAVAASNQNQADQNDPVPDQKPAAAPIRKSARRRRGRPKKQQPVAENDDDDVIVLDDKDEEYAVLPGAASAAAPPPPVAAPVPAKKRRIVSVNYASLNLQQLKKKLQEAGLETHGTRAELQARHAEFLTLAQAAADSFGTEQPSQRSLAHQVHQREQERQQQGRVAQRQAQYLQKLVAQQGQQREQEETKQPDVADEDWSAGPPLPLHSGNAAFDRQLQSGFGALIAQLKQQKAAEKKKEKKGGDGDQKDQAAASPRDEINDKDNEQHQGRSDDNEDQKVQAAALNANPSSVAAKNSFSEKLVSVDGENTTGSSNNNDTDSVSNGQVGDDSLAVVTNNSGSNSSSSFSSRSNHQQHESNHMLARSSSQSSTHSKEDEPPNLPRRPHQKSIQNCLPAATQQSQSKKQKIRHSSSSSSAAAASTSTGSEFLDDSGGSIDPYPQHVGNSNNNRKSISGPWACETCTFYNQQRIWSRATCEMCEAPRPSV